MKKTIIRNILVGVTTVGLSACSFLDTAPYDFLIPDMFYQNETECTWALSGIYSTLATQEVYGHNYSCFFTNIDDLSFYTRENTQAVQSNKYFTDDSSIWGTWVELYSGINNANVLLENIDKANISDEKIRNRIKGEAKFLRAYYHFLLVQGWYEVPVRIVSTKDATSASQAATPHADAIDWIIDEMEQCLDLVDDSEYDLSPSHIKKTIVQGILARVCLWRAGNPSNGGKPFYEKAVTYCKAIRESRKHKLNTEDIYALWKHMAMDSYDLTFNESMWEVEFIGSRSDGNWTEGRIGRTIGNKQENQSLTGAGLGYGYFAGSLLLYDLYGENDKRKDLSLAPYRLDKNDKQIAHGGNTIRYCGKYRREWTTIGVKDKNFTNYNYCVLRYADVLLMLAEAENEFHQGPTAEAYSAINEVRTRAGILPLSDMSYDEFQKELQDERARELCFESLRKFDLVRWGIYYNRLKTDLKNATESLRWKGHNKNQLIVAPKQYVENTDEKHQFFPIPTKELSSNDMIQQNKYWK